MKIALLGYGKMGKMIEQIINERNRAASKTDLSIVLKVDSENAGKVTASDLAGADVAIDFSIPGAAYPNMLMCFEAGVPVVVGTTGWKDKLGDAKAKCKENDGALLYASNFSIGVNIFFEINSRLAGLMNDQRQYDVRIEETHHTQKLDSPSGTAITLAEELLRKITRKENWKNESTDKPEELVILSHREPEVPGTHMVRYESEIDSIEITHTAHSRRGFAEGALEAAGWVIGKHGVFTMKDVLGI